VSRLRPGAEAELGHAGAVGHEQECQRAPAQRALAAFDGPEREQRGGHHQQRHAEQQREPHPRVAAAVRPLERVEAAEAAVEAVADLVPVAGQEQPGGEACHNEAAAEGRERDGDS
jgi:hypothetical protein